MTNFNPIQIISQITATAVGNYLTNNKNNDSAAIKNDALNSTFNTVIQSSSVTQGAIFTASSYPVLSLQSELKLTTIEIEQKARYVKDLLNLPEDFSALIDEIVSSASNSSNQALNNTLSSLFQDGKINLTLLVSLLNGNSKEAVQKLLMVISDISRQGANDLSSLKELMGLLNINSNVISENQALKNLMLLYLPWLPLTLRYEKDLDFTIDIHDKITGPNPDDSTPVEVVKLLIETINFKNVLAILQMNESGNIDIYISANNSFPEKKAIELISLDAKNSNINPNIMIDSKNSESSSEKVLLNRNAPDEASNNVQITSSNMVSPKLMLMAHSLIKIIIELDYNETVIKNKEDDEQAEDEG